MPSLICVPGETRAGERRSAMAPALASKWLEAGARLKLESGGGEPAGFPDARYRELQGLELAEQRRALFSEADLVLCVRRPGLEDLRAMRPGTALVGFLAPWERDDFLRGLAEQRINAFAVERIPRISRAQSMDALSSQAAVAGYKSVLIAAEHLPRFFPMLTTAAGTIRPARALVIGAGVAGLQAIATARRLGARVEAFDVRTAVAEQVESLGAKFVDTGVSAEGAGGYARELTDEEKRQQQQVLAEHVARADVVITTAAVPGRPAPRIIDAGMVTDMKHGAVLVDLAAETGGNCELTEPGKVIRHGAATVVGPLDVASAIAEHASEMYARNLFNFIRPCLDENGEIHWDLQDAVYAESVVTWDGEIRQPRES